MSFSSEVKDELENKIDSAKHCQIAEFAAFMGMGGNIIETPSYELELEFATENELALRKYKFLLKKIFDIDEAGYQEFSSGTKDKTFVLKITDKENVAKIIMTLKWSDDTFEEINQSFCDARIVKKDCCKRAFIRGAFIMAGSISDPNKSYHYEIVCRYEEDANQLVEILSFFGLDAKYAFRKNSVIVYIKEGNNITDALNIMGAINSQMQLFNVMILKDISNNINRKVNCETANLNKTVAAAVKQIKDIELIRDTIGLDSLNEGLREVAYIRLEHTDYNLKDIGEMLDPVVSKSGVNHRLRKIGEIADDLRSARNIPLDT